MNDNDEPITGEVETVFDHMHEITLSREQHVSEKLIFQLWLALPRSQRWPATAKELAEQLGVRYQTLSEWRHSPGFADAVALAALEFVKTERVVAIMENMCEIAMGKSSQAVQAARLVLETVGLSRGPALQVNNTQINVEEYTQEFDSPLEKLKAYIDQVRQRDALAQTNGHHHIESAE